MKKLHLFFICLFYSLTLFCQSVKKYIPDSNFRYLLNSRYPEIMDITGDSLIIDSASVVTDYFYCTSEDIADLSGIEYFTNIRGLECSFNNLTSLPDLSANTSIEILNCEGNKLTSLPNLSANSVLKYLNCSNNNISVMSGLPGSLISLKCGYNRLIQLPDLSTCVALKLLYCYANELTSLPDLFNNKHLEVLKCGGNSIKKLPDFSHNTELKTLDCINNEIVVLPDFSNNTKLQEMYCKDNRLDYSDAKELRIIDALPELFGFTYESQKPFGKSDSLFLNRGDTLKINIAHQDSAKGYQWYKNYFGTIDEATDTILIIPDVTNEDEGIYTCNSYGTALGYPIMKHGSGNIIFKSEPIYVFVEKSNELYLNEISDFKLYPNPTDRYIYLESEAVLKFEIYNSLGINIISSEDRIGSSLILR